MMNSMNVNGLTHVHSVHHGRRALALIVRTHGVHIWYDEPEGVVMGARTTTRESRLFVRCGRREKALIEAAAAALGMTVSEYVLSTVMDRSMAEVQRRNRLALSGEAFDQLAELMENDAEPAAGLVENARRYRDAMARRSLTVAD